MLSCSHVEHLPVSCQATAAPPHPAAPTAVGLPVLQLAVPFQMHKVYMQKGCVGVILGEGYHTGY